MKLANKTVNAITRPRNEYRVGGGGVPYGCDWVMLVLVVRIPGAHDRIGCFAKLEQF